MNVETNIPMSGGIIKARTSGDKCLLPIRYCAGPWGYEVHKIASYSQGASNTPGEPDREAISQHKRV